MEPRSWIQARQEIERLRLEVAELRRQEETRNRERERRDSHRQQEREQIRQNNRRLNIEDIAHEDRIIQFTKNQVTERSADIEYVEYFADNTCKRCKVYGPTQAYFVAKSDGDKVLRFEYKTAGFSIENIQLKYIAREEKFLMEFDGHLEVNLRVSFPIVDPRGMATIELSPDGTLTFSVPLIVDPIVFDNDANELVHYEKNGILCGKTEDFKSWNDVD